MNTRLLGAAVLIALAVLFIPMFFSSTPPPAGGDQSVNLAIPPAPDRDLQTRTMSLNPQESASSTAVGAPATMVTPGSADKLATVDIASQRPRDVETDADAGKQPGQTTVTTGSGASPEQPVIPMQGQSTESAAVKPKSTETTPKPSSVPITHAASTTPPPAGHGSYTVNLSAYASASSVTKLQHRVQALGYPVRTHPVTVKGQSLTAVTTGPFETRTAAEAARLKITQSIPGVPAQLAQDASHESGAGNAPSAAPASAASSKAGGWAVQLAAVSSKADAIALRDKLRANGFDGFVDSVQSGGKQLWRVRAGPQTQRADAQRIHDEIKSKLGIDGNIVSVP